MKKTRLKIEHGFHLVPPSPWPIVTALGVGAMFTIFLLLLHGYEVPKSAVICFAAGICGVYFWFIDIINEAAYLGRHTSRVRGNLKRGFQLFLVSEFMLFFTYFWAFAHFRLSPSIELGSTWPPVELDIVSPFGLVLVNTAMLVASGITLEYSRRELSLGNTRWALVGLGIVISEAIAFTLIQGTEYFLAPFDITDGAFGSVFFSVTGLHAIHVILGTLLLIAAAYRLIKGEFTKEHNLGIVFAAWYWHFVDAMWILVYLFIYLGSWINF